MSGEEEEFLELVTRYARVMSSVVRRVCGQRFRTLVPDVEQEIYAELWKVVRSGKKIAHPTSYLYKVALTTALGMVRKHSHETVPLAEGEVEGELPRGGKLLPAEEEVLLAQVLEQLEPEERRAVRAYLAGFGHAEVARLYGWSESVARHRIYRGIEALKRKMKR